MRFLFFPLLGGFLFLACSKPGSDTVLDCPGEGRVQAELIRKGCEAYVFRLIEYSPDAQAEWTDIFTKKEYSNVISVLNYCGDDQNSKDLQVLNAGEFVSFNLTATQEHCAILCLVYEASPDPTFKVSKVVRCSN
jgi:hypothetical protein